MYVQHVSRFSELTRWSGDWDRLAGSDPFVSRCWLSHWWHHYGRDHQLYTLVVRDQPGQIVAIAPWFLERSPAKGRRIKFLGSGHVCSDYMRILVDSDQIRAVTHALAQWLIAANTAGEHTQWDFISLDGALASEPSLQQLSQHLSAAGCLINDEPKSDCWRLELPGDFESYHQDLKKNVRCKVRRMIRDYLDTGRASLRYAESQKEFEAYYEALVALHQRRRISLGDCGCFASDQFRDFFRGVCQTCFRQGRLLISQLLIDDQIGAASVGIHAADVHYMYQTGMEPNLQQRQPGWLMNLLTIRHAIDHGIRAIDYLRGDEPYKAHLGAQNRVTNKSHIVANHVSARMRNQLWRARTVALGRGLPALGLHAMEIDAGGVTPIPDATV